MTLARSAGGSLMREVGSRVEAMARKLARAAHPRINPDALVYIGAPWKISTPQGDGFVVPTIDPIVSPLWCQYITMAEVALSDA
jgi:hypothetical protein